jgi:NADP-dependent 3-hydroxy acid dehydrogenase YdfG
VKDFASKLENLDIVPHILINNAGLAVSRNKIQEGIIEDWERMIDTNVKGLLYVSRYILPMMIKKNTGLVINIGSTAGHIIYPGGNVYHAAKYAVKALNEAMNLDLVDTNIKVCSIDPGAVETEFSLVRFKGDEANAKKVYEGYEALEASDIADIAVFVASRPARVNIQNLIVYPTAQRSVYVHKKDS